MARPEVKLSAAALLAGLNPWPMLTTDDPFEQALHQAIIVAALDLQEVRDENLAIRIANNVGKLFKKR